MLELKNETLNQLLTDKFYELCHAYKEKLYKVRAQYEDQKLELSPQCKELDEYIGAFITNIENSWDSSLTAKRTYHQLESYTQALHGKMIELANEHLQTDHKTKVYLVVEIPDFYTELLKNTLAKMKDFEWLLYTNTLEQWREVLGDTYPKTFQEWLVQNNLQSKFYGKSMDTVKSEISEKMFVELAENLTTKFKFNDEFVKALDHLQKCVDGYIEIYEDVLLSLIKEV